MNVQTRPDRLKPAGALFPAVADQPIRAAFLPEDRLRALGEALAQGRGWPPAGPRRIRFPRPQPRERDAAFSTPTARPTPRRRSGEPITPAAQWLLDNNYLVEETIFQIKRDLPRRFYANCRPSRSRNGSRVPRALAVAWLYVAHSDSAVSAQMLKAVVDGYQKRRAVPDRRIVGDPLAAALRSDREPAPHRGAREARARDAPDRQRHRRPRAGLGRRRRPPRHPVGLHRACARHDVCHAAALPPARWFAQCGRGAGLAGGGTGDLRLRRRRDRRSPSITRCPAATSPPATSSAACA